MVNNFSRHLVLCVVCIWGTAIICCAQQKDKCVIRFDRISLKEAKTKFIRASFVCIKYDYFSTLNYLYLSAPLNMNLLNRNNLRFCGGIYEYDNDNKIVKIKAPSWVSKNKAIIRYHNDIINGKSYCTQLIIDSTVRNKKTTFTMDLKYKFIQDGNGTNIPVAEKLIITSLGGQNSVFYHENMNCPGTGKTEVALVKKCGALENYNFSIEKKDIIYDYFYIKKNGRLFLVKSIIFKKFYEKYELLEIKENNKTTKFEYYDNKIEDGKYYGKIKKIINPDLSEKRYTYFSDGIIKTVNTVKP